MNPFFKAEDQNRFAKLLMVFVALLCVYFLVKTFSEGRNYRNMATTATINVSGQGDSFAIPDVATETFTVEQKATTVKEAQDTVNTKINDAIAFLKTQDIAEKDIKTTSYSANPEYTYPVVAPCYYGNCPQPGSPKITGYTVSETVSVKLHDTTKVGAVIDGLGAKGISNLSGPDFSVDNPDGVQAEARAKAIDDAQAKAKVLAKQLGVRIVRIVGYSDGADYGNPTPMYEAMDSKMAVGAAAPTAVLPAGQNKYTSNVTITYEVR